MSPELSAWQEYHQALIKLHIDADRPSTRAVAKRATTSMSHVTVNDVLRGKRLPGWPVLRDIVCALEGDHDRFHDLWRAAVQELDRRAPIAPAPPPRSASDSLILNELIAIRRLLERLLER